MIGANAGLNFGQIKSFFVTNVYHRKNDLSNRKIRTMSKLLIKSNGPEPLTLKTNTVLMP